MQWWTIVVLSLLVLTAAVAWQHSEAQRSEELKETYPQRSLPSSPLKLKRATLKNSLNALKSEPDLLTRRRALRACSSCSTPKRTTSSLS